MATEAGDVDATTGPPHRVRDRIPVSLVVLSCCLLSTAPPTRAQRAGEPVAGGGGTHVRYLLPPSDQAPPAWTDEEQRRGYVVYTASYCDAMWPRQVPTRERIVERVACHLARDEYEPIQIGVFGVGTDGPLEHAKVVVDVDLPAQIRFLKYRERTPNARQLRHLGATPVPYHLRLGDTHERIEPGHTGAFWITFHAGVDAAPGPHHGTITVSVDGKDDLTLALTVDVRPFRLPRPDIAYGMYHYRVTSLMQNEGYAARIQRDQAAHGMNSSTLMVQDPIRYEGGRLVFPVTYESRQHDRIERGMDDPRVPTMLMDYQLINWHSGRINDDLTDRQKQEIARQYLAYTHARNFPEFLAYVQDEPSLDQPESYFRWVTGWKKTPMRTVAAMSGEAAAGLGHLHDVWVVHTGQITRETVREAWRQGAEVWTYTFSMGAYNVHSNRYMAGLYTWALGLRGNFHWAYFHNDHFVILESEGPDPLVAWEGRREGIDDYRYLMLLEALVDRAAPDSAPARAAGAWLDELRAGVDLAFFHGFTGSSRVDGPFCHPAPDLDLDDYDRIRARAVDFCLQLGADGLERFAPRPYVRSRAAKWEAQPFARATVGACATALSDPDPCARRAAAASLAERGASALSAAGGLKKLLTDPEVRLVAARALGTLGPEADGAADAIALLFEDEDAYVRMVAALALGGLEAQSVPALRRALRDREAQVIKIAGHALAELGPAAAPAVPDLIPMVQHEVELVRRAAFKAIEGIGPGAAPATGALVREFERQGSRNAYIARAIGAIGPDARAAVPALEQARDDKHWSTAINAALFRIRGEKADLDAIVRLLREPGDRYTCEYAAQALEGLGADAAPVADDVRAFLGEQDDKYAESHSHIVGRLDRYFEKVRAAE